MKRTLLLLLVLILGASLCLFSCNNENTANSGNNNSDKEDNLDNTPPSTLEYELSEDGSYYIVTGIGTYDKYDLIIPETHEGKPVKDIAPGAFYSCYGIITVTIPDTIAVITHNVFADCRDLVSVTIGKNVTEIKEYAFRYCNKIVEVINNSPSVTITNDESNGGVGLNAHSISNAEENCLSKIKIEDNGYIIYNNEDAKFLMGTVEDCQRITVDNGINGIYNYAFIENKSAVWLEVNTPLKFIGEHAFDGCYNLLSVVLREEVLEIRDKAFCNCRKLSEAVSMKGPHIGSGTDNGWLAKAKSVINGKEEYTSKLHYTDDGYVFFEEWLNRPLIAYVGEETELTLPKWTKHIDSYAFANNDKIKKVSLNRDLESVGYGAFENCTSLESVVFWKPNMQDLGIDRWGMRLIKSKAFAGCTALKEIFIPKEVVEISSATFDNCKGLKIFCEHGRPDSNVFQRDWYDSLDSSAYYYSYEEPSWDIYEYVDFWHYVDGKRVIWERPE